MIIKDFSFYLTNFFNEYMSNHKNFSKNTIMLYRDCFILFFRFCEESKNINVDTLTFSQISKELILEFLSWLEDINKSSIQTRNQRLAALKSFCKFVEFEAPEFYDVCSSIRSIEPKKYEKKSPSYLSIEAMKLLLQQPNADNKAELRDLALLSLMYDSGARVQEIIDLHISDLTLQNKLTLHVVGKGQKAREIPINKSTAKILKKYISLYGLMNSDHLFVNKYGNKLTRQGVLYILNKYITRARNQCSELFCNNITNHSCRHSKAMHLLEDGVNLIYIKDFLGHSSVSTTEMYARANPEIRRNEIEKASKTLITKSKFSENKKSGLLMFLKDLI